jgi:hypothetical protein
MTLSVRWLYGINDVIRNLVNSDIQTLTDFIYLLESVFDSLSDKGNKFRNSNEVTSVGRKKYVLLFSPCKVTSQHII